MINIELQPLLMFQLGFLRAIALLVACPVYRTAGNIRLRIGLAGMLTLFAMPRFTLSQELAIDGSLVGLAIYNVLAGLALGFAVRLVFGIIEYAGAILSMEMGLSLSAAFDPVAGYTSTLMSRFLFALAIFIFFTAGFYQEVLLGFVRSFDLQPLDTIPSTVMAVDTLVSASTNIFVTALKIAAPVMAMNFLVNLAFAVLGKVVPKLNVFMTSMAFRIWAGFFVFGAAFTLICRYIIRAYGSAVETGLQAIFYTQ